MFRTTKNRFTLIALLALIFQATSPLAAATLTVPASSTVLSDFRSTIQHQVAQETALGEPFTLAIGESAMIDDGDNHIEVELSGLLSDSRCPSDVDCVVAGQAVFAVKVTLNDETLLHDEAIGSYLGSEPSELIFGEYKLTLADVQPPAPASNRRLRQKDYLVTLLVERTDLQNLPTPKPSQQIPDDGAVGLGDAFDLRIGETMALHDADISVTLRSLSDDSGCFLPDDCSTMTADGSLALVAGDEKELLSFSAGLSPESPFVYEFAGYDVQMTHVERGEDGELVASFVVVQHAAEPPFEIPAAEPVDSCQYLSRYDAMAILQEDTVTTAMDNFILGPLNENTPELDGLCGYGSIAWTGNKEIDPSLPHLLTSYPSDQLVVAGLLKGTHADELLPLVETSRLANPDGDDMDVLRIQTQLIAGQYEEIIRTIFNNAEASESIGVMKLNGIGNEAIWLWQSVGDGHFAAVLARNDDKFALVSALVNSEVDEANTLDYMEILARRMLMPRRMTTEIEPPVNQQQTQQQQSTLPPGQGCDLFSATDAAAILGEEVYEQAVIQDEGCGYVPTSELSPEDPDFSMANTDHGVMIGQLQAENTLEFVQGLVLQMSENNPLADQADVDAILSLIDAGDVSDALRLLPTLTGEQGNFKIELFEEISDTTILVTESGGSEFIFWVMSLNEEGASTILFASLDHEKQFETAREVLVELFQKIAEQ